MQLGFYAKEFSGSSFFTPLGNRWPGEDQPMAGNFTENTMVCIEFLHV